MLVAFSHLDREPLTTYERRLSGPTDDLSQAGNPGSFLVPSLPGNPAYRSVWTAAFDSNRNGVADFVEPTLGLPAVPGAQPPVFADQNCTAIAAQDPKVVPGDRGQRAEPDRHDSDRPLLSSISAASTRSCPRRQRSSAFAEVTHAFGDTLQGRIEAHIADNEALRNNSPSFPFAAFPTVAASHPDNPYGSDVRFIGRIIGAGGVPIESIHNSDTWRLAASLAGGVDNTWVWEIGAQYSENDFFVSAPDVLVDRFNNAIRGFGGADCNSTRPARAGVAPCVYFNPFGTSLTGTGTRNSPELFDYLVGFESFDAHSELVVARGLRVARARRARRRPRRHRRRRAVSRRRAVVRLRREREPRQFLVPGRQSRLRRRPRHRRLVRRVCAAVQRNAEPATGRAATKTTATASTPTDPKASLLWRPSTRSSRCARSVGTSFRAPSLFQAFGTQTTLAELIDPSVGTPQFFPVRTQPNPSGAALSPEEADVFNVGVSLSPTEAWEIGIDYWSFDYTNVIIEQNAQAILNAAAQGNAQARSQVIRDAGERPVAARRLVLCERVGARDRRLRPARDAASSSSAAAAR